MRIFNKHVKGVSDKPTIAADVVDGTLAIYNAAEGKWIPVAAGNLPVSAAGVTATTLNAALAELAAADV